MRAVLLHQPGSGGTGPSAEELMAGLHTAGLDPRYAPMDDDCWYDALDGAELVVVAGGDGTVGRVLAAMSGHAGRLAILPLGSANNIAVSLGYPARDLDSLVQGFRGGSDVAFHIGEVRGRWGVRRFVESVGLGALTRSTRELQDEHLAGGEKRTAGREALVRTLTSLDPIRVSISADGESLSDPILLVECMNITTVGPGLRLGPAATPERDGLLLVWLPVELRRAMLEWLADPEADREPPLLHKTVRSVAIDGLDEPLRIDDKTVTWDGSRIDLRVLDRPVTVLVPRQVERATW